MISVPLPTTVLIVPAAMPAAAIAAISAAPTGGDPSAGTEDARGGCSGRCPEWIIGTPVAASPAARTRHLPFGLGSLPVLHSR